VCSFLGAVVSPLLVGDCDIRNGIGSSKTVVVVKQHSKEH